MRCLEIALVMSLLIGCTGEEEALLIRGCTDPLSLNFNVEAERDDRTCEYGSIAFYSSRATHLDLGQGIAGITENLVSFSISVGGTSLGTVRDSLLTAPSTCETMENVIVYEFPGSDELQFRFSLETIDVRGGARTVRGANVRLTPSPTECISYNVINEYLQ